MLIVIDTYRNGDEHAPFNAAFLTLLTKVYNKKSLQFFALDLHLLSVEKILCQNGINGDNLNFSNLSTISKRNSTIGILISYLVSSFHDLRLMINSNQHDLIFFATVNPLSLLNIKLLNIFLRRKIYIVLHGELEYLNKSNDVSHSIKTRFIRMWFRNVFWRFLNTNIKYVVLGKSILDSLNSFKSFGLKSSNFFVINHPYFYPTKIDNDLSSSKVLNVATVGHLSTKKMSHLIFSLAKIMEPEIKENKISISIIGNVSACIKPYLGNCLISQNIGDIFLTRKEYELGFNQLHYVVFFYPDTTYKFIASGAFFDCIAFEKPVIAVKNSFFQYYFDKYGDIGYLCEDMFEMKSFINGYDEKRYLRQIDNIRKMKQDLSIEKIASEFKALLEI
jgi:hypothetical protein